MVGLYVQTCNRLRLDAAEEDLAVGGGRWGNSVGTASRFSRLR